MMARRLDTSDVGFHEAFNDLIALRGERMDEAEGAARAVIADVRARGVDAVLAFAAKFDGVAMKAADLRVSEQEIGDAFARCAPDLIEALRFAEARVRGFHARQAPQDSLYVDETGVTLGWRWTPVDAAGLYAPGGLAAYPSAVIMNAAAAKAAGVERLVMVTPPGKILENPAILAAARIAGVDEIWKIGGAQAIAALAYGAGDLAPVDVIAGPGNAFVAAAKKLVFGDVGIDSIAGPSEVFILSDGRVDPTWIAADLLAQAEHDPDAQSVLFTPDRAFADAVADGVAMLLPRAGPAAEESWRRHGAIVIVQTLEEACALCNRAAPEHVQIATANADRLSRHIRHAGAIFLGAYAPEALGDYVAGPNHVLPTGRRARFASGLSPLAFMKRTSLIGADSSAVARIGLQAARIADAEGLPAHALSVRLRLGDD